MQCKNCGKELKDNAKFCDQCGTKVTEADSPEQMPENSESTAPAEAAVTAEETAAAPTGAKAKNKKALLIVVIAAVLVAAGIFTGLHMTHVICFHKWQDATCTEPKTCTVCGKIEGEALGHDASEVTCTEDSVCRRCGEVLEKAAGHQWVEATCQKPKTCSVCGATEGEVAEHQWKDATCTEPKTCSVCGATEEKPAGHQWKDATCTEPKTCTVCGATDGKALGHDWKEATLSAPKTCARCGETSGEKLKLTSLDTPSIYTVVKEVPVALNGMGKEMYSGTHSCDVVCWDAIPNADGYEVSYVKHYGYESEGTATVSNEMQKVGTNTFVFGNLTAHNENEYSPTQLEHLAVRAYANTDDGVIYSEWSNEITAVWQ